MSKAKLGILVGSLREESYSRKVADVLVQLADKNLVDISILNIDDLEMYNEDLDTDTPPESWRVYRDSVKALDGVVFITPEYNRSIPPVLKNAIDIASRPYGHNAWNDKAGSIISTSAGSLGGFGANHDVRQIMAVLNVHTMQQPEAYISEVYKLFDEDGILNNESTKEFLQEFIDSFITWTNRIK